MKVLAVYRNPQTLAEVSSAAKELRCGVIESSDLVKALEQYITQEPDITFLSDDIEFRSHIPPHYPGEFVSMARKHESENGRKRGVIYLTGTSVGVTLRGADGYINLGTFVSGDTANKIKRYIESVPLSRKPVSRF